MQQIRIKQRLAMVPESNLPPVHEPEMLYIGCSDARLDPIDDLGIPKGKALIYRNIAALVRPGAHEENSGPLDKSAIFSTGEIPESTSMGAALEFFVNEAPQKPGVVKHIVVSGHTHCGGIRACMHGTSQPAKYLPAYLSVLDGAKAKVLAKMPNASDDEKLREMERESVRESVANLMSYEVVRKAVDEGRVQVHGWVLDTATQRINELRRDEFKYMGDGQSSTMAV